MTIYYVDPSSGSTSDANAGTDPANPWETVTRVETALNDGDLNPGDRVRLVRGNTWTQASDASMVYLNAATISSGTKASPIVLEAYGTGAMPVMDMNGYTQSWFRRANIAPSNGGHFITIRGIEIIGVDGKSCVNGQQTEGWIVEDCYIHSATADGSGIHMDEGSFDFVVRNNVLIGLPGEGIYTGTAGGTDETKDGLIYGNLMIDCDGEAIDCKSPCRNIVIAYNYASGCGDYGASGAPQFQIDGYSHTVFRNVIGPDRPNTDGGISIGQREDTGAIGKNILCIDNLVIDNDGPDGGIRCDGVDNTIINNTIIGCDRGVVLDYKTGYSHTSHIVRNNVLSGNTYDYYRIAGATTDFDIDYDATDNTGTIWYWSGDRDLTYVQGTLGFESNISTASLNFAETDRYTPSATSGFLNNGDSTYRFIDWRNRYASGSPDRGWSQLQAFSHAYFQDDFESGDFARWGVSSGSGVVISTSTVHAGDNSAGVTVGSTTYKERQNLGDLRRIFASIYINTGSLSTSDTSERVKWLLFYNSSGTDSVWCELKWSGSVWQIRARMDNDASSTSSTSYYSLAAGWNRVDLEISIAYDTNADGYLNLYIDGAIQEQLSAIDNDTLTIDRVRMGSNGTISSATGTFYLDDLRLEVTPNGPFEPVLIDTNVKALWQFADSGDLEADTTNYGNDLTATSTPNYTAQGVPLGSNLTGVNLAAGEYFSIASPGFPTAPPMTIAFTVTHQNDGGSQGVLGWGDETSDRGIVVQKASDDKLNLRFSTNGTSWAIDDDSLVELREFQTYHVAIIWKADGDVDLYINGRLDNSWTLGSSINSPSANFVVGIRSAGSAIDLEGQFGEVTVIADEWSADQVETWGRYGFYGDPATIAAGSVPLIINHLRQQGIQ